MSTEPNACIPECEGHPSTTKKGSTSRRQARSAHLGRRTRHSIPVQDDDDDDDNSDNEDLLISSHAHDDKEVCSPAEFSIVQLLITLVFSDARF